VSDLLHLHERKRLVSKRGANGNPAEGTAGPKRRERTRIRAPALMIPVPMGTLVRDKRGNRLAELVQRGQAYRVCQGGRGGRGTLVPSHAKTVRRRDRKLQVRAAPTSRRRATVPLSTAAGTGRRRGARGRGGYKLESGCGRGSW
jgi:GTPase